MPTKFQLNSNGECTLSTGCVKPDTISTRSGDEMAVLRQRHLHVKETTFGLATTATPITATFDLHTAIAAGTISLFRARLKVDGSSTGITVDLKKNGTTILSGTIALTDSTGDGVIVTGTVSTPNYIAGDVFTVVLTMTTNTGAQGPWAQAVFDELAA